MVSSSRRTPSIDGTVASDRDKNIVPTSYHQISDTVSETRSLQHPNSTLSQLDTRSLPRSAPTETNYNRPIHNDTRSLPRPPSSFSPNSFERMSLTRSSTPSTPPPSRPRHIDNSNLLLQSPKVPSLTSEGGKLKSKVNEGEDFIVIPERLWKALMQWYGGSPSLPRQVIRYKTGEVAIEFYPLNVKIYKHQTISRPTTTPAVVGGYTSMTSNMTSTTRRYHAYQAAFSKRTTVGQIGDYLSQRLHVKLEDLRLWLFRDEHNMKLLEDEFVALEDVGFREDESILCEVSS